MAEFLLELFSEEIPARMQQQAATDLKQRVTAQLQAAGLDFDQADSYVTPRRLCLHITGLDREQPDRQEARRGPRADAPDQAVAGFLRGTGLTRDQLEVREEKKGRFFYALIEKKGQKTAALLAAFLPDIIRNFPWPKSQRWGGKSLRWVRPLHRILCLFDGQIVTFDLGDGLSAGAKTEGHRFLAPAAFSVTDFADYRQKLAQASVILDPAERKEIIYQQAVTLTTAEGLVLQEDKSLLAEVVGLAEYPVVLMGDFDPDFLTIPAEALSSAMKSHQKYFSVTDKQGRLRNKFIFVANMKTSDNGARIIDGNQRVLRARLADTGFFWDQDLKIRLEDRLPALDDIVFHAKLGSVGARVGRIMTLSGHIAGIIGADEVQARRAAQLCKADLTSGMVGEFADLQGLMGKYYAEKQKEPAAVALAIAEHYAPKGPQDRCPSAPVSIAVALAEKIDTLIGFFAIDEKPTGSKDPFALRRAALGVIRLILENNLRVPLGSLYALAAQSYGAVVSGDIAPALGDFFADRLKVHLKEQDVRHDLISAVFALGHEDDLVRLLARVSALQRFLATDAGANLLAGYKRAANILKDAPVSGEAVAGTMPEECALFERLQTVAPATESAVCAENFEEAMQKLATLRPDIDAFFEKVTVNSTDKTERLNRLRLLTQIRDTMNRVADFSKIEG